MLIAALAVTGCINVPKRIDVNFNDNSPKRPSGSGDESRHTQLPASGGGSWREVATGLAGGVFLSADHGVIFRAFDTLAYPGRPVDLAAKVTRQEGMKALAGATVSFVVDGDVLGEAVVDSGGLATISWTPPKEGDYSVSAVITAVPRGAPGEILDASPAPLLVAARAKDTRFVVIDLDHTVVDASFFRVLVGDPRPMPRSVEVTGRIAKTYGIIYLTHRPDLLTRKSKQWLTEHGYPAGPLLVSELSQAFGDSGKFKTAKLKAVRKAYPNVEVGIGDKLSDALAYVDNGLTAYLIPNYKDKPDDMRKMAGKIRALGDRAGLNVVDGWLEIESGIFRGTSYSPSQYAARLDRRARQMQQQRERRKKSKGGNDDD